MLKFNIHPHHVVLFFKPRSLSALIKQELLDIGEGIELLNPEEFQTQVAESTLRGNVSYNSYRDVIEYTSITVFSAHIVTKTFTLPYNYTKDSLRSFRLSTCHSADYRNNQKTVLIYVIKVKTKETYDRLEVLEQNQHLVTSTWQIESFLRETQGITTAPLREQELYEEPSV